MSVIEVDFSEFNGSPLLSISATGGYASNLTPVEAEQRAADAIARSIVDTPIGMHPFVKWLIWGIGVAIAAVFLIQLVIAVAYLVGVVIIVLLGAIFLARVLVGD